MRPHSLLVKGKKTMKARSSKRRRNRCMKEEESVMNDMSYEKMKKRENGAAAAAAAKKSLVWWVCRLLHRLHLQAAGEEEICICTSHFLFVCFGMKAHLLPSHLHASLTPAISLEK